MSKCYFVTGTDTEVGKTVASCAFTSRKGSRLPDGRLQTGGLWQRKTPKGLRNSDALALQRNSSLQLDSRNGKSLHLRRTHLAAHHQRARGRGR